MRLNSLNRIIKRQNMFSGHPTPLPHDPSKGEESVWHYPRPPLLEKITDHIQVYFNNELIIDSNGGYRVLETSHPPTYYIPYSALKSEYFKNAGGSNSFCEWKGAASYYSVCVNGKTAEKVAWTYKNPTGMFSSIKDHVALYAGPMDKCTVNGEIVTPQPGSFYGGWITSKIKGPFKGIPGSNMW